MLKRLIMPPTWASLVLYAKGGDPRDVWEFTSGALTAKVINGWRSGARLLVDLETLSSNSDMLAVNGSNLLLAATVTDRMGQPREIKVFMRAWLHARIRVSVDGVFLTEKFV